MSAEHQNSHEPTVDLTQTAGDLVVGDVVNDDKTYDRIRIESIHPFVGHREDSDEVDDGEPENLVRFTGTREKAGDTVVRTWLANDGVVLRKTT